MMRDDERGRSGNEEHGWRAQIDLPADMVDSFRKWWDAEGWWSFRSWHERSLSDSEWEKFMRRLCSGPSDDKRSAACCDPTDPTLR